MKLLTELNDYVVAAVPVGSRVTCNPPPTDTDQDILCLVEEDILEEFETYLMEENWEFEGEDYAGTKKGDFMSWRGDFDGTEYNLIITTEEKWFDSFMDATFSCKEKNLMTKAERIAEFDKFMPKAHVKSKVQGVMEQMHAQLAMQKAQQDLWNQVPPPNQGGFAKYTGTPFTGSNLYIDLGPWTGGITKVNQW